MDEESLAHSSHQHWTLDDLDWDAIKKTDRSIVDEFFYMIAAASFMEITTDRYTENLVDKFSDDAEIAVWLREHWQHEEVQHGHALRRYVQVAWPDFDWDRAYAQFMEEFEAYCAPDKLEPTRGREMASRCVVETGTASFYTMLNRMSREPVLAELARLIADDEVRHYKHFYRYFRHFQVEEPQSRLTVATALWNRLRMINGEDNVVAIKHLYAARNPGRAFDRHAYKHIRVGQRDLIRRHFPHRMSVQMLLKPLELKPGAQHVAVSVAEAVARRLVP